MATVEFSQSVRLSIRLDGDVCVCGSIEHPFDAAARAAIASAANAFRHVPSVPLATSLSLLSHLFWLARNVLHEPVLAPIVVIHGADRSSHHDPVAAICTAFLSLMDPDRETCQTALVRFIYSFAPPSPVSSRRTALADMLAEAALTTFVHALQTAAYFGVKQDELGELVRVPRKRDTSLQWLSHNTGVLPVLRHLAATQIIAFRELVTVAMAVFGHNPPADETCDLVGAALDVAAGAPCRIADITAATRVWLGSAPFAPTVSQAELERLRRLDDDALSVWARGIGLAQPALQTFRASAIFPATQRKRPLPQEARCSESKRVRFSLGDFF
jgi:hypothetical protein